jgi:hypothetical protein
MILAVATTLTAIMLTAFMVRDRTWTDGATTIMAAALWGMAIYLWLRVARARRAGGGEPHA